MTLLQATEAMMNSSAKIKQDDKGSKLKNNNGASISKKEKQLNKIKIS